MIKSRQVQAEVKYLHSPKAIHFRTISKKNRTAKTKLTIFRMNMSSSSSWRLMSSKHRERLDAKIRRRIVHSKKGLSTVLNTNWRIPCQHFPMHVSPRKAQQPNLKKHLAKKNCITLCYESKQFSTKLLKISYNLSHRIGQHGSGVFLFSSSSVVPPPSARVPTPSSKVRLLLGPEIWMAKIRFLFLHDHNKVPESWNWLLKNHFTKE